MVLKGQKVVLRPVRLSDAGRFVKWFNDPEVNKFLRIRQMKLKEELKWIKNIRKGKKGYQFSIDTKTGSHIGSTGLEIIQRRNNNAEFGIMIGDKRYWNKGYGTEASKLVLKYAFEKLKLHRVALDVYAYNKRAIKVYKRLGFKLEGTKRDQIFYAGKYHDVFYMGMLDKEWRHKK